MRKPLIILLLSLFFCTPQAFAKYWEITSFNSDIAIQKDSGLIVSETITASFNGSYQGMYRTFPVKYDRHGFAYKLRFKVLSVTDKNGSSLKHTISHSGRYRKIKIWLPGILRNPVQTVVLKYRIYRAINFFEDHDELYYNVTGNEWPVPIIASSARVTLPEGTDERGIQATAYTGAYGSRNQQCDISKGNDTVSFTTRVQLGYREGLTIVVGFPKGTISKPSILLRILWFLTDNWPFFIPIGVLILLLYLWNTRGRDPGRERSVMVQYDPPDGMTPAEVGTLIDETVDLRDISAAVVDLAVKGYVKIEEKEEKGLFKKTDYTFIKQKEFENDQRLRDHEKELLKGIFGSKKTVKLSDLSNKFYKKLPKIKEKLYEKLVKEKYFAKRPDKVRGKYVVTGVLIAFGGFFIGAIMHMLSLLISLIVTGIIVVIFAKLMPRKTLKGTHAYKHALGFEEYLSRAEKEELKNAAPETFEKFLPYAMAFGVVKEWAEAFKDIYTVPPRWYGGHTGAFSTYYFATSLNSMSRDMNRTFVSSPRGSGASGGSSGFGGGGFSGGGFGGGGGGAF